jgi:DNA-binding response OmpR family regulator
MNILLVEDDVGIGRFVSQGLRVRGWQVRWERVGKDVPALAGSGRFNTIILDLLLPDSDGLNLCRDIRQQELGIPILMLTARSGLDDRLDGFAAGADDYLAKPFAFEELLARLRALLKRDRLRKPDPVNLGALRIDPTAGLATWAGQPITISRRAFTLLLVLARAGGEAVGRDKLIDEIWGGDTIVTDNALDVCASALRRALAGATDRLALEAVRGHGYALRLLPGDPEVKSAPRDERR